MKFRLLLLIAVALASDFAVSADSPWPDLKGSLQELQTQQANIAANQTTIDSKVADLAEQVRLARLYVSRAGGAHKAPPP